MTRRHLLASTLAAPLATSSLFASPRLPIRKAVLLSMLPTELSFNDRFQLAADCGFEQVEAYTVSDENIADEIKKASDLAKVPIHSVMNSDHWKFPLSSPDAEVVAKCRAGMETSIRNAKLWGAETVLLVLASTTAGTSRTVSAPQSLALRMLVSMPARHLATTSGSGEERGNFQWSEFMTEWMGTLARSEAFLISSATFGSETV